MAGRIDYAVLPGKYRKDYLFKFYPLNLVLRRFPKFPDEEGVYTFAKEKHNNDTGCSEYEALYVGQTESFEDRLVEAHLHWECAKKHECNSIGIYAMAESSRKDREDIENDIICEQDPPCNKAEG